MAVGCLIYLTPEGVVYHRQPLWPWPSPGVYPFQNPDGTWVQFFPVNYSRFKLGDRVTPFPPVPYTPSKEKQK